MKTPVTVEEKSKLEKFPKRDFLRLVTHYIQCNTEGDSRTVYEIAHRCLYLTRKIRTLKRNPPV